MLGPGSADHIRAWTLPKRLQNLACEVGRPALTRYYAIAGRSLCVEALDEGSATLSENFLKDFYLVRLTDGFVSKPSYTIKIRSRETPPSVPDGLEGFEVAFGHCYVNGHCYYLEVEESLVVVRSQSEQLIDVWIGRSAYARQPLSLVNVLSYVLEAALRRCGLYQLHGSGVVEPKTNSCALMIGESGSGKSTLATLLAARGWSYLTDDALLLNHEEDVVRARGMRKFFAASERTLAACRLPEIISALGPPITSDPSKRRLEPEIAFPGRAKESCIPGLLLFTSITNKPKSVISSLSSGEAMARLIRFNPWASYDKATAREHLRLLSRLANQCQSFSLGAGLDVLAEPSYAEELLTPLLKP